MSRSEWASAVAVPFQGDCAPSAMPPAAALLMLPLLRCHFASASSYRVLSVKAASPRGLVQASRELFDKVSSGRSDKIQESRVGAVRLEKGRLSLDKACAIKKPPHKRSMQLESAYHDRVQHALGGTRGGERLMPSSERNPSPKTAQP